MGEHVGSNKGFDIPGGINRLRLGCLIRHLGPKMFVLCGLYVRDGCVWCVRLSFSLSFPLSVSEHGEGTSLVLSVLLNSPTSAFWFLPVCRILCLIRHVPPCAARVFNHGTWRPLSSASPWPPLWTRSPFVTKLFPARIGSQTQTQTNIPLSNWENGSIVRLSVSISHATKQKINWRRNN